MKTNCSSDTNCTTPGQKCFININGTNKSCQEVNSKNYGNRCTVNSTNECERTSLACGGTVGAETCVWTKTTACSNNELCEGDYTCQGPVTPGYDEFCDVESDKCTVGLACDQLEGIPLCRVKAN